MKKNERVNNIILSIETSVQGGCISLLENNKELDSWQGMGSISKSDNILDELSSLLTKNKIEKNQIGRIVISRGPGSFTGMRIGLAIVLGLKKSLNCDICGVSVLEAMALKSENIDWNKNIIAAIPIGTMVCIQKIKIGQKRKLNKATIPYLVSIEKFIEQLEDDLESNFVLHERLYKALLVNVQTGNQIVERITSSGENLAYLVGLLGKESCVSDDLQPIYIKTVT
ncbi:MAG: tRNA (adenosine(37)-N6)-threonylcarbamoyltransferase complex dimerization subunit type 1 TsaB [Nitrosopumilus sp.]|nr:tRNA (adenosine(37)-N6)-threonylcarbamoyltransferase complex dimerization subunit type 1 TsaB [Nitrosopumilus sp.]